MPEQTEHFLVEFSTTGYPETVGQVAEYERRMAEMQESIAAGFPTLEQALSYQGRSQEMTNRYADALERAQQVSQEAGITLKEAWLQVAPAIFQTKEAVEDTGRATSLWATESRRMIGYAGRYLVRYFLIWQGMRAIQGYIHGVIESHDELNRAMLRFRIATDATDTQVRQYMNTLMQMSREAAMPMAGLVGPMMAGGAETAQWGGQLARITGGGAQQWQQLLRQLRDDYGLTIAETEGMLDRLVYAWAKSGVSIEEFIRDWQRYLRVIEGVIVPIDTFERALEEASRTGADASQRLSASWRNYQATVGDTTAVTTAKAALADYLDFATTGLMALKEIEEKTGVPLVVAPGYPQTIVGAMGPLWQRIAEGLPSAPETAGGPETTTHEQWRLTGQLPGAGEAQFGLVGWMGRMTEAEFRRTEERKDYYKRMLELQGVRLVWQERTVMVETEQGEDIRRIRIASEVLPLIQEDIRDMASGLTGMFNWPATSMPFAMAFGPSAISGQVQTGGGEAMSRAAQGLDAVASAAQRAAISLPMITKPFTREPALPTTPEHPVLLPPPIMQPWAGGGATGGPPPPWTAPSGGAGAPTGMNVGALNVKAELNVNGEKMAETTSRVLGDKLQQALRSTGYGVGGLLSP